MKKEEISIGSIYEGVSGCRKKVTAIEGEEGKSKTVVAEIVKVGAGKGNHKPVGTIVRTAEKAFAIWAQSEAK